MKIEQHDECDLANIPASLPPYEKPLSTITIGFLISPHLVVAVASLMTSAAVNAGRRESLTNLLASLPTLSSPLLGSKSCVKHQVEADYWIGT